jgi:hypothetical protein
MTAIDETRLDQLAGRLRTASYKVQYKAVNGDDVSVLGSTVGSSFIAVRDVNPT